MVNEEVKWYSNLWPLASRALADYCKLKENDSDDCKWWNPKSVVAGNSSPIDSLEGGEPAALANHGDKFIAFNNRDGQKFRLKCNEVNEEYDCLLGVWRKPFFGGTGGVLMSCSGSEKLEPDVTFIYEDAADSISNDNADIISKDFADATPKDVPKDIADTSSKETFDSYKVPCTAQSEDCINLKEGFNKLSIDNKTVSICEGTYKSDLQVTGSNGALIVKDVTIEGGRFVFENNEHFKVCIDGTIFDGKKSDSEEAVISFNNSKGGVLEIGSVWVSKYPKSSAIEVKGAIDIKAELLNLYSVRQALNLYCLAGTKVHDSKFVRDEDYNDPNYYSGCMYLTGPCWVQDVKCEKFVDGITIESGLGTVLQNVLVFKGGLTVGSGTGIKVRETSASIIKDCYIGNHQVGISFLLGYGGNEDFSQHNIVKNTTIGWNKVGIHIENMGAYNTFFGNTVNHNDIGVSFCNPASECMWVCNDFIGNKQIVEIENGENCNVPASEENKSKIYSIANNNWLDSNKVEPVCSWEEPAL